LTEIGLAALGYSETIILRPGLLTEVKREHSSLVESVALKVHSTLSSVFSFSGMAASISSVAKAATVAGSLGVSGLPASIETKKMGDANAPFALIENRSILALADAFKRK